MAVTFKLRGYTFKLGKKIFWIGNKWKEKAEVFVESLPIAILCMKHLSTSYFQLQGARCLGWQSNPNTASFREVFQTLSPFQVCLSCGLLNNSGFSGGEVPCQKLHAEACDKLYIPSPSLIQYKQHQNQMCFSWMKTSTVSTAENHSPCLTETSSKRLLHNQHRAAAVRWCSSEHLHQAMLIVLG